MSGDAHLETLIANLLADEDVRSAPPPLLDRVVRRTHGTGQRRARLRVPDRGRRRRLWLALLAAALVLASATVLLSGSRPADDGPALLPGPSASNFGTSSIAEPSPTPTPPPFDLSDACTLLRPSDLAAVTVDSEEDWAPGRRGGPGLIGLEGSVTCAWRGPLDSAAATLTVLAAGGRVHYDGQVGQAGQRTPTDTPFHRVHTSIGRGDRAVVFTPTDRPPALFAVRGDVEIAISVRFDSGRSEEFERAEIALARLVFARIP